VTNLKSDRKHLIFVFNLTLLFTNFSQNQRRDTVQSVSDHSQLLQYSQSLRTELHACNTACTECDVELSVLQSCARVKFSPATFPADLPLLILTSLRFHPRQWWSAPATTRAQTRNLQRVSVGAWVQESDYSALQSALQTTVW